jgi:hypothetical protein
VIYPSGNIPENLRDFEYIGIKPEEVIKLSNRMEAYHSKSYNAATRYV